MATTADATIISETEKLTEQEWPFTKITSAEQLNEFKSKGPCIIYATVYEMPDAFTKNILDTFVGEVRSFLKTDKCKDIRFGSLCLRTQEELAETENFSALSQFGAYHKGIRISETSQTNELSDLKKLLHELAEPHNIMPHSIGDKASLEEAVGKSMLLAIYCTNKGPCETNEPFLKKLAAEQSDSRKNISGTDELVAYRKIVQGPETDALLTELGVTDFPSLVGYSNGSKVCVSLTDSKEALENAIKTLIDPAYVNPCPEVKTLAEYKTIVNSGKPVVVDFTASWCPPCQRIKPVFKKLAMEHKDVTFIKVDVDVNSETSAACQVRSMPTFHFYLSTESAAADSELAKPLHTMSGASEDKLKKSIATLKSIAAERSSSTDASFEKIKTVTDETLNAAKQSELAVLLYTSEDDFGALEAKLRSLALDQKDSGVNIMGSSAEVAFKAIRIDDEQATKTAVNGTVEYYRNGELQTSEASGSEEKVIFELKKLIEPKYVDPCPYETAGNFEEFKNNFLQDAKRITVVDFTASWCGPCRYLKPLFAQLAEKYQQDGENRVQFMKVDADANKGLCVDCEVECYPTIQFYVGDVRKDKVEGADMDEIKEKITKLLGEIGSE